MNEKKRDRKTESSQKNLTECNTLIQTIVALPTDKPLFRAAAHIKIVYLPVGPIFFPYSEPPEHRSST